MNAGRAPRSRPAASRSPGPVGLASAGQRPGQSQRRSPGPRYPPPGPPPRALSLGGHNHARPTPRRPRKSTGLRVEVPAEGQTSFVPRAPVAGHSLGLEDPRAPGGAGLGCRFAPLAVRPGRASCAVHMLSIPGRFTARLMGSPGRAHDGRPSASGFPVAL